MDSEQLDQLDADITEELDEPTPESRLRDEANQLVALLTLADKAALLSGADFWHTKAVERLDIPAACMSDGPHGLRRQLSDTGTGDSHPATCFPTASALACTFDRDLVSRVGAAIAEECHEQDVHLLLGPGINIKRSPLCGRNFEYFSEDPYLAGEVASAFVDGVQSKGVGSCVKHFCANNQETRRMTVDAQVDERALHEIYLSPFERVVKKSAPWAVMSSYNRLNGSYVGEQRELITDTLRTRWGFRGLVVSDWGAVNDRVATVAAGLDLEMPGGDGHTAEQIIAAARSGRLSLDAIDACVRHIIEFALRSSRREPVRGNARLHHWLARVAESEAAVLLKNNGALLPGSVGQKAAVIGAFAAEPRFQGAGSSKVHAKVVDTPLDALQKAGLAFEYAEGYTLDGRIDEKLLAAACDAAVGKDVVYLFVGLPESYEAEGVDRTGMELPENQIRLIERVAAVNPHVAVVLMGGSPIDVAWEKFVPTILLAHLGGEAVGAAIADLLIGRANPSGKLAETWPLTLAHNPSYHTFPGTGNTVEYREGIFVGYRYYDTVRLPVRYPFGHGLSYTEFAYRDLELSATEFADGDKLEVSVEVENVGEVAGTEVVQLYVSRRGSSAPMPEQELAGFERVVLSPGQAKRVTFTLDSKAFSHYSPAVGDWVVEAGEYQVRVGSASRDIRCHAKVDVASDAPADAFAVPEGAEGYCNLGDYITEDGLKVPDELFEALLGRPLPGPEEKAPATPPAVEADDIDYGRFSPNSTLSEIRSTWTGRRVWNIVEKAIRKSEPDPKQAENTLRMLGDMPLRTMLMSGNDFLDRTTLDGILDILNGKRTRGFRRIISKIGG